LIGIWLAEGRKIAAIARQLGRSKSTISREVRRNGPRIQKRSYLPHKAQERSEKRRKSSYADRLRMNDKRTHDYVTGRLMKGWSPELIAGRISIDRARISISHEAIYRWIYSEGREYISFLTRKHRRRWRKGNSRRPHKYNIPSRVSIDDRPEVINKRGEAGHWEVDTAFFHHSSEVLQVMSERKTRYTLLAKLKDITAQEMRETMVKQHWCTPTHLRKSFTYDNGRENTYHMYINTQFGSRSYFCHPGHSWEKGTVENTIGIIRRFLPKKAKFRAVSSEQLKIIEDWLNNRPRKCLGFRTPREAYRQERCT